jgi:hypothetical protein
MRAAQSGRSLTSIHADDGPFESCGNIPSVGGKTREHPLVELGGNRTPVHQAMSVRDTTIPDTVALWQQCRVRWVDAEVFTCGRFSNKSMV